MIARVAGLPAAAIDPFLGGDAGEALAAWREAERAAATARSTLSEALHALVPRLAAAERRLVLDVRRACFNGRPLAAFARRQGWQDLAVSLGPCFEAVLALEVRLAEAGDRLRLSHQAAVSRAGADGTAALADRRFLRAVALASPDLIEALARRAGRPEAAHDRKLRRLERSLVRYVSRASLKLSPYSTLTAIGLATAEDGAAQGCALRGSRWHDLSLVRVRRFIVEDIFICLARHPAVRHRLAVTLNGTLERLDGDSYRLLRPTGFSYDEAAATLRRTMASHVRVRLSGPIIDRLLALPSPAARTYGELLADLSAHCAAPGEAAEAVEESVAGTVDRLIEIGFLELRAPWASHAVRIEERLVAFLRGISLPEPAARLAATLDRLLVEEEGFAAAPEPAAALDRLRETLTEAWQQAGELVAVQREMGLPEAQLSSFYEDVAVTDASARPGSGLGEVVHLARGTAAELLACGNAIWKIFSLFNPSHNFRHSLAAFWRRTEPRPGDGGGMPSFLQVFAAAQPLWRDYVSARRRHQAVDFDPYGLPEIAELQEVRRAIRERLDGLRDSRGPHDAAAFAAIAGSIPARYDSLVGCCLFVQPADETGERWVVNRIFEGTGRYSCRFTAGLPPAARQALIGQFERASVLAPGGQPGAAARPLPPGLEGCRVELLDVLYGRENTANEHWPQTRRVLELPGEPSDLPRERRLDLADLLVDLGGTEGALPVLRGHDGTVFLPCQMSVVDRIYMPVILKFLVMFGPTGYQPSIFPSWATRELGGGVKILDRLTFGRLIFRRKRWVVPAALLPDFGAEPWIFFRDVGRTLEAFEVPRQVFWMEPVKGPGPGPSYKPQFLDFSSPLFVSLLQARSFEEEALTFEEALPGPRDFPRRAGGDDRWGVEVLLESLPEVLP